VTVGVLTHEQNLKDGRREEKLFAGSRFPGYARGITEGREAGGMKRGRNMSSRGRQSEIAKRRETRYPTDSDPAKEG